jgi:hypothetical protein
MLLQEILRDSKCRKQQGVILKIDFEKAYDKFNWDFLLDCCRKKGLVKLGWPGSIKLFQEGL